MERDQLAPAETELGHNHHHHHLEAAQESVTITIEVIVAITIIVSNPFFTVAPKFIWIPLTPPTFLLAARIMALWLTAGYLSYVVAN